MFPQQQSSRSAKLIIYVISEGRLRMQGALMARKGKILRYFKRSDCLVDGHEQVREIRQSQGKHCAVC